MRIEQADQLLVSNPCVYDTTRRRITAVAEQGRQQYRSFQVIQLMLGAHEILHAMWRIYIPRVKGSISKTYSF